MVKKSKGTLPKAQKTFGSVLLFAILWPVLIAVLIHGNLLDSVIANLSTSASGLVINAIVLIPPAIALLPLVYKLDVIYDTGKRSAPSPAWQRIVLSILAIALALWLLWYVYILSSIALTV